MFDKLKRKFILINMLLLTTVFIAIFGTIFVTNSIRMNSDMERELYKSIRGPFKPGIGEPRSGTTILIDMNENGDIISTFSLMSFDETIIKNVAINILGSNKTIGKITVEDESFAYLKQDTPYGTRIVMISRAQQQAMMLNLLETFLIIGGISLVFLLIISIYLTNKTIKPIKEAFEKQKQFIADASHELKTPLTIINTNTSLILSNPEDTVKNQSKWLKYINLQSERMSELINEMLSLAKLDTDQNQLQLEEINISKIISTMLLSFDAIIFENMIRLESDIDKNIIMKGHSDSIKKLFSIIMDNAIKHTNKNGEIDVKLKLDKNNVKLTIKNTGEGISEEHLEKIFERFYRVDSSRDRETGGYGLGLSIAKSIVNQHKGKIYAESNVGKDTTFIVELPVKCL